MKRLFHSVKRFFDKFIEIEYWYRFRKIKTFWFDDDKNKYELSTYPGRAENVLRSTWEGETDILYHLLLKLDHMFWNLKKYGVEKDYYIYSTDIHKYATVKDIQIIIRNIIKQNLNKRGIHVLSYKTTNASLSNSGYLRFYLRKNFDKNSIQLVVAGDKLIPQNKIPKSKKLYSIDSSWGDNGEFKYQRHLADQYKEVDIDVIGEWRLDSIKDIESYVLDKVSLFLDRDIYDYLKKEDKNFLKKDWSPVVLNESLIDRLDTNVQLDYNFKDISQLSEGLRKHAVGNFVKCRDILHLRRLVKDIIKLDSNNNKYDYLWISENDDKKRNEMIIKARNRYEKDRKDAYKKFSDFMCEKSPNWWD